jgi:hypothetical protein
MTRNGTVHSTCLKVLVPHYFQAIGNGNYYFSSRSVKGAGLSDWCRLIIAGSDTSAVSLGRPLNTSGENLDFFYTTGTKPDYSDVYVYWVRIDSAIDSLKRMSKTDLQK